MHFRGNFKGISWECEGVLGRGFVGGVLREWFRGVFVWCKMVTYVGMGSSSSSSSSSSAAGGRKRGRSATPARSEKSAKRIKVDKFLEAARKKADKRN